jgi:hypothetical protein
MQPVEAHAAPFAAPRARAQHGSWCTADKTIASSSDGGAGHARCAPSRVYSSA